MGERLHCLKKVVSFKQIFRNYKEQLNRRRRRRRRKDY